MLIIAASPHAGGVTDQLAAAAAMTAGTAPLYLRDYSFAPCDNCGSCASAGICRHNDDAAMLYEQLNISQSLLIVAPIYFYALPAHFKAFIDRSQQFWQREHFSARPSKNAGIILTAGRKTGEKLFSGAELTLRYFLKPFAFAITHRLFCCGADTDKKFLCNHIPAAASMASDLSRYASNAGMATVEAS